MRVGLPVAQFGGPEVESLDRFRLVGNRDLGLAQGRNGLFEGDEQSPVGVFPEGDLGPARDLAYLQVEGVQAQLLDGPLHGLEAYGCSTRNPAVAEVRGHVEGKVEHVDLPFGTIALGGGVEGPGELAPVPALQGVAVLGAQVGGKDQGEGQKDGGLVHEGVSFCL